MADPRAQRSPPRRNVAAIVIGRNEGERLRTCLESVTRAIDRVVYVDSGSGDGSVELARAFGLAVVELDPSEPFTAARARNAGAAEVAERFEGIDHLQFIDGDCELEEEWSAKAASFLDSNPDVAVVCGRLRERHPDASIYNRLCDMEWNGPVGDVAACGGIALIRADAFHAVSGFNARLIAGEEPDLCFRLRQSGWRIVRIDAPMAIHDAAMFHPRQWWQRNQRSGFAAMEAYWLRGDQEPELRRRVWSNLIWALPVAWPLWPFLWLKIWRRDGALYASHIVLGKLPHLHGQIRYLAKGRGGGAVQLIEHK